jgi:hypothetical protein
MAEMSTAAMGLRPDRRPSGAATALALALAGVAGCSTITDPAAPGGTPADARPPGDGDPDGGVEGPGPADAATCTAGDDQVEDPATGHCYTMFLQALSWQDARTACATRGGHLAVPTSQAENALVASIAPSLPGQIRGDLWLGAADLATEGTFLWESGEAFSYTSWRTGEPNNLGNNANEDCLTIDALAKWNDRDCISLQWYICENE